MQIAGSTVLLTGATGGIGLAIARAVHERGGKLIVTGRRVDVLEPLAQELGARALAVDLAEPAEVDRLVREAGEIDILIANAALPASGRLESFTPQEIDRALDVNLRAPIMLAHSLLPAMVERRSGHLLFMSSIAGKAASPGTLLYTASKFGLRGFASSLRADLHGSGVGVSTVLPGFIREAGMFAEAEVKLPPGVGTRTPKDVADATIKAIEHNRGEIEVAPLAFRATATFASVAPEFAARISRKAGGEQIAHDMAAGQRHKR
jgi:short-subunit dehydrogenase